MTPPIPVETDALPALISQLWDMEPNEWRSQRIEANLRNPDGFLYYISHLLKIATTKKTAPTVRALALQFLGQIPDTRGHDINHVCQHWVSRRNPDLEKLIIEKDWMTNYPTKTAIYTALLTGRVSRYQLANPSLEELKALAQASQDKKNKLLAERADQALCQLSDSWLEELAKVWLEIPSTLIADIFDKRNYLPISPVAARVGLALYLGKWEIQILTAGAEVVIPLVEACASGNPVMAARAKEWLARLENPGAQNALCEMVIYSDQPLIEQIALAQGWFPDRLADRVLFYFITGQWEKYDKLDFDRRLLRAAYHSATPALRRKLTGLIRALGRVDLLEVIVGGETRLRATEITAEEAEVLVQTCVAGQDWAGLWSLVPLLPINWSAEAVRQLDWARWQGPSEDTRQTLAKLIPLAYGDMVTSEVEAARWLPLALLRSQARLSASKTGRINSIAFSLRRPLLAIATQNSKIILWNMNTAEAEMVIEGSADHAVGALAFSGEDLLCWGERTRPSDNLAKVYVWRDGTRIELGEHRGGVTVLRAVGKNWLLSGGRDGRVILWDLNSGQAIKEIRLGYGYDRCVRDIAVSSDQQKAVVLDRGATVLSLPEFEIISETDFDDFGTVPRAILAPDQKSLVICKMESYPRQAAIDENWQISSKLEILKQASIQGKHQLPGVGVLADLGLVLIRTQKGMVEIVDWASRQPMAELALPVTQNFYHYITCLEISPDGNLMAVNDQDATIMLYDLRPLAVRRLFGYPLAKAGVSHLMALAALRESDTPFPQALEAAFQYIEIILKDLRLRYEIELVEVETASIRAGEFDIGLDN